MFTGSRLKKYLPIFAFLITACSWMYPREGGIALIGKLGSDNKSINSLAPVSGCTYDVISSTGDKVYSGMQLYSRGTKVSISHSVAPGEHLYTVNIFCSGQLVKEVKTKSMATSPTNMGLINAK